MEYHLDIKNGLINACSSMGVCLFPREHHFESRSQAEDAFNAYSGLKDAIKVLHIANSTQRKKLVESVKVERMIQLPKAHYTKQMITERLNKQTWSFNFITETATAHVVLLASEVVIDHWDLIGLFPKGEFKE